MKKRVHEKSKPDEDQGPLNEEHFLSEEKVVIFGDT